MDVELLYKDIKIKDGDVVVFGCSYGPDSMALFHTLLTLRKKIDIKLICAHVNHGKRKESEEENEQTRDRIQKNITNPIQIEETTGTLLVIHSIQINKRSLGN